MIIDTSNMAQAAGDDIDEVEQPVEQKPLEKKHENAAAMNLEKVTGIVEEKEMNKAQIAAVRSALSRVRGPAPFSRPPRPPSLSCS
jgi:hypothetical protein